MKSGCYALMSHANENRGVHRSENWRTMTEMGQSLPKFDVRVTSAFDPIATKSLTFQHFGAWAKKRHYIRSRTNPSLSFANGGNNRSASVRRTARASPAGQSASAAALQTAGTSLALSRPALAQVEKATTSATDWLSYGGDMLVISKIITD